MGRPLKKSLFGADAKNNIKVQFFNGTASKPGYIVKQIGSRRFKCSDAAGNVQICKLVAKAAGTLTAGEMTITVKLDSGAVVQVVKIADRVVTTSDGMRHPWSFSTSNTDGAAQIEEAGTSTAAISTSTGATNLEGDVEA